MFKNIIAFIVTTALILSLYPGGSPAFALSLEEERIAGEKFVENIRKQFDLVDDDVANEYIYNLGQYLTRFLETKHFPFHFYIVNHHDLNAFAGPGGHIFIFSGLLEVMDDVDELAAVICHEMGHVSARHLASRIEQHKKIALATMVGMLAGALIGGKAAGAIMTGSMAAGIQKQLSYSRNDERQADQLGFRYMEASGFDPSGMITVLKKLERTQWIGPDAMPPYLLTHPGGPERIANTDIMMASYEAKPDNRETREFRRLFPFLKTTLRAKYTAPQEAERLFRLELEKDPKSALARFGLGILCKERSEYVKAIDHFQKALSVQPESLPILRNLAEAYQLKGQDREAIRVLQRALDVDNQDKASLFLLAMSYQNLESYAKAIRIYERLASLEPVKDEVLYNLGISYGRQNRLALAHYYFGIYFKRLREMSKAEFHFQRAEDLSGNDEALRRKIHDAMKGTASG